MSKRINPKVFLITFSVSIFVLGLFGSGAYLLINSEILPRSSNEEVSTPDENSNILGESVQNNEDAEEDNSDNTSEENITQLENDSADSQENSITGSNDENNSPSQDPENNDNTGSPSDSPVIKQKPDLIISSCVATVTSDGKATFSVSVKNIGTANAKNFYSYLYVDPSPVPPSEPTDYLYENDNGLFTTLVPGQSYTWSKSGISLPSGQHKAYCWVDKDNTVDELNENNNITSKSFNITFKPDLVFEYTNVKVNSDNTVDVAMKVKNIGNSNARDFETYFYIDPSPAPPQNPISYSYYDHFGFYVQLPPGASFTYSKSNIELDTGQHSLYFWVDRNDQVDESNEVNNIKNTTFLVPTNNPVIWDVEQPFCECISIVRKPDWSTNTMNIMVKWTANSSAELITIKRQYGSVFSLEYGEMGKKAPYMLALPHIAGTQDIFDDGGLNHFRPTSSSPGSNWTVWLKKNY